MRATLLLLASVLLVGCRATPPPAPEPDSARIHELEARVAWLEAQVKAATVVEDEMLDLEVQHAAMLVTHTPDHPAVLNIERRIEAVARVHAFEERARRDAMRHRLEAERDNLLRSYTPEHPSVQKVDAKIAFLKADR